MTKKNLLKRLGKSQSELLSILSRLEWDRDDMFEYIDKTEYSVARESLYSSMMKLSSIIAKIDQPF